MGIDMEINWFEILGLIVFPFSVATMVAVILYNKIACPRGKKKDKLISQLKRPWLKLFKSRNAHIVNNNFCFWVAIV